MPTNDWTIIDDIMLESDLADEAWFEERQFWENYNELCSTFYEEFCISE